MANMSYCRFQNTLLALRDCASALAAIRDGEEPPLEGYEARSAEELLALAASLDEFAENIKALVVPAHLSEEAKIHSDACKCGASNCRGRAVQAALGALKGGF